MKENKSSICNQQGLVNMTQLFTSLLTSRKLPRLYVVSVRKILFNCRHSLYLTPALLQAVVYRIYHAVDLSVYKGKGCGGEGDDKQPFSVAGTHLHRGGIN